MDFTEGTQSIDKDSLADLLRSVSETAQTLFTAGSATETLASVVDLAVTTIDGCDYAGIFLLDGGVITTSAHTDPVVAEIDTLQQQANEGPCLDAIAHRMVFYAEDLISELRWPTFSPQAVASGIRSVLALPLTADAQLGAVNLYARFPIPFGVVDRAKAAILASLASLALTIAHSHDDEQRRAINFQAALSSRETIGEAMGILMERERISADQAFGILRRASQHLNIKLREVAQNLVDTGEDPQTGPALPR
jgi:GAF domain-containing protein